MAVLISVHPNAGADGTRSWTQSKYEEFSKGTATNIAINNSGAIELAPEIRQVLASPSAYIWGLAADDTGNVFAAAGSPARVYQVAADGKASIIFEAKELQVQAVAVAGAAIYAATAPDGRVYRLQRKANDATAKAAKSESRSEATNGRPDKDTVPIDSSWSATEVFAPKAKYIWALAADGAGDIYVATGDPAEIHKLTPKGDHTLLFKSDETHIRSLALDLKGNVIAGSDPSGLVYRISPSGEGFVIYSAPKKEVTALAVDSTGNIYASVAGEKRSGSGASSGVPVVPTPLAITGVISTTPQPQVPVTTTTQAPLVMINPNSLAGAGGGSEIYKIAPDGTPVRTWYSREDLVYALAADTNAQLLAGTGNHGKILTFRGVDEFSDSGKVTSAQVTAFARTKNGTLYAAASNLGKIFAIGPKAASEGIFESDVFDAKTYSQWGRVEFRGAGNVDLFVRSGNVENPDRNWSSWQKVDPNKDAIAQIPGARFAQWKAVLHAGNVEPRVESVTLNYLPRNIAPAIDDVSVQLGVRYQIAPKAPGSSSISDSGNSGMPRFESPPASTHDRDAIGVKWSAHDDNDDQLTYSLYYRGDGETQWLLLKDKLTDKAYSFDASMLPDGGYEVKVVASDAPSHTPGEALTASKQSARFEVDTTPPRVEGLSASLENGQIRVRFHAIDSFSPISKAEFSVDAGDWQYAEPVGQISDSKTEDYDFRVPAPAGSEHVVVVRVYDRYENMGAAKTVLRAK